MRRLVLFGCLVGVFIPSVVWACGGFFSPDDPMDQLSEQMIFTVNGNGTITAIVGIDYQGEASEFSWLLPVPSVPEIAVAERATLDDLQLATNLAFQLPNNECSAIQEYGGFGGGGGGEPEMGTIGPYEYVILGGEDVPDVIGWLRENNYKVEPEAEPIMQEYLDMGMKFVAMRLQPDAAIGDIQPVQLTFEAEQPMIPIKMASFSAPDFDIPIFVWIFADTRYAPANYESVSVEFSHFRGFDTLGYPRPLDDAYYRYDYERRELFYAHDQAFITEYAQPTSNLPPFADPLLADLAARFPYVTRLYTQLSPDEMTLDPMFAPAPDLPDVSNEIVMNDHVNPLIYWGCTTRATLDSTRMEHLPAGRTRIDEWRLQLAHPEDWVQSNFDFNNQPVVAFAPETVTADNFLNGDIPVLFATEFANGVPPNIFQPLNGFLPENYAGTFFASRDGLYSKWENPDVMVAMAANTQLWNENAELFRAMIWYGGNTYQYYRHAEMPHTLFVTPSINEEEFAFYTHVEIPYPDGWTESINDNGVMVVRDEATGSEIRVTRLAEDLRYAPEDAQNQIETLYDLPADTAWQFVNEMGCLGEGSLPVPFEKEGRTGYVRQTPLAIIEVSAPTDSFAESGALLQTVITSAYSSVTCG